MAAPDFTQTIEIKAPPSTVWDAIVNPAVVEKYHLAPLKVIELKPGGKIAYGTANDDMILGEVAEVETGKRLKHTFRFRPSQEGTQNDPETTVCYEIAETPAGASLRLTHAGFAEENQTYANISGGWPFILDGLKAAVEK